MIKTILIFISILGLTVLQGCEQDAPKQEAIKIIFDTDCGPDYDDVGALAVLTCHGRQREG